ncbi:MAG: ligase-associated DNA damage response endonuclease PdeM [Chitinophagales bacterium]|nr:ligase-associated DNA damage response endonuclease PdeM [Chitinophagales bacterium]
MGEHLTIQLQGENLVLLPQRAIYWEQQQILLASDLHLGKSGHFRKAGIAVSSEIHHDDLKRLSAILKEFPVKKIFFLGDLFHSDQNYEWTQFLTWRKSILPIEIHWIKGNHDAPDSEWIITSEIHYHTSHFEHQPFFFTHQMILQEHLSKYQMAGHLHPAIRLTGKGKQSIKLPCFYFSDNYCVLPAFGNFTAGAVIRPKINDKVFMILENKVLPMKGYK